MATYLITYDLKRPGQDYDRLLTHIQTYPWWHCFQSVWIIKSHKSASAIRDDLQRFVDGNDLLLVIEVTNQWASYNLSKECADWLQTNL